VKVVGSRQYRLVIRGIHDMALVFGNDCRHNGSPVRLRCPWTDRAGALGILPDGRLTYQLKRPVPDSRTELVLRPTELATGPARAAWYCDSRG
jgi:hypothetical protein